MIGIRSPGPGGAVSEDHAGRAATDDRQAKSRPVRGPFVRSLRIVMLTTFYPPFSFGGDAVGVQRMARALAARGHAVTVVHDEDAYLTSGAQPPAPLDGDDGVEIVGLRSRLPRVSSLLTHQAGRPVVHRQTIRAVLEDRKPDIVWYNNVSLVGGPGLLGLGQGLRVYEAHEHWLVCPTHVLWRFGRELCDGQKCLRCVLSYRRPPQLWRHTGYLPRMLERVDLLIAKSEFSRDMHHRFGLEREMQVLPYFLPDLAPPDAPPRRLHPRPYFLFVGRLEKIKGLQDVIPLFAGEGAADLLILGDGEYADELRRLAGANPRVVFLGRRPPEELTDFYRGAEALIVPSVCYETFGIILIESFRIGTPVIARRLGPFPEIVEAAGGGLLFETPDELRAAMRRMIEDRTLRDRLGRCARAAFVERWSEGPVLAAHGAALAEAAHRRGDAPLARALEAGSFEHGAAVA
jgi:glycosyltransferase involved in cell wall biosynthesis